MNAFKLNRSSTKVERLNELLTLEYGWGPDGDEQPVTREAVQGVLDFVNNAGSEVFVKSFGLFPTPEGGILLEGNPQVEKYDMLSIEVEPDGKFCVDLWSAPDFSIESEETPCSAVDAVKILQEKFMFKQDILEVVSDLNVKPETSYGFVQVKFNHQWVKLPLTVSSGFTTVSHVVNFEKTEGYDCSVNNLSIFDSLCGERIVGSVNGFVESFVQLESLVNNVDVGSFYNCQECLKTGVFLVGTQS